MEDTEVLDSINALSHEEHQLLHDGEQGGGLSDEQHTRLGEIKVELDRLWDLLRQRRGRRHAGLNPATAKERDASIVENFKQ